MFVCFSLAGLSIRAQASSPANTGLFATANTAETAYLNPAGMTRLEGSHKTLQGILVYSFAEFDVDKDLTSVTGGNPDSDNTPIIIPGFYYTRQLNEEWWLGLSANIPSGFGSNYGDDWAGRYYSDQFTLVYVGLNPALAYRVNEKWSLGLGANINYTYSQSKNAVNNPDPGVKDGKAEYEGDGFAVGGNISVLYELNDRTRFGLVYSSEVSTDVDGDVKLSGISLPPQAGQSGGQKKKVDLTVENILPQRVQAGLYHELDSGNYLTLDGVWIDFSKFSSGAVTVQDTIEVEPEGIYDDIWAVNAGYGMPLGGGKTLKFGALYVSNAVDDEDRTLSLRLDSIWGVGTGMTFEKGEHLLDVNFNLYYLGKAPVDTGFSPVKGRVVGETSNPWAVALDVAWHW
jgi:long-chain fatty acid transport protein